MRAYVVRRFYIPHVDYRVVQQLIVPPLLKDTRSFLPLVLCSRWEAGLHTHLLPFMSIIAAYMRNSEIKHRKSPEWWMSSQRE